MTTAEIFDSIARSYDPATAKGLSGTIQFNLSGADGGEWYLSVGEGGIDVGRGAAPAAALTVSASATDYAAIATGKIPPQVAFMQGKLKFKGDLGLAMKMQGLFKPISA
ncbi:SCP2 sterol-binding domain-containing protein [bacterium]|nr:SCP2 sterol-binding domain-containing protein [bacterium]